jgi:hypothetical protein
MKHKKLFRKTDMALLALGAVLLTTLTGCVGYVEGPHYAVNDEPAVFVAQDDYVYYPGYNVYYSDRRHQYAYQEGGAWVSRPAPRGVSVDVLLASPSVRMDFHDSPAQHHAQVVQKYPRNWAPPRTNQDPKEKQDKRDERKDRNDK